MAKKRRRVRKVCGPIDEATAEVCIFAIGRIIDPENPKAIDPMLIPPHHEPNGDYICRCFMIEQIRPLKPGE